MRDQEDAFIPRLHPKPSCTGHTGNGNRLVDTMSNFTSSDKSGHIGNRCEHFFDPIRNFKNTHQKHVPSKKTDASQNPDPKSMTLKSSENKLRSPSSPKVNVSENGEIARSLGNTFETKQIVLSQSSDGGNACHFNLHDDCSSTPPIRGANTSLVVSAKRYGSEVRRQHMKKRRRRRRPSSSSLDSKSDLNDLRCCVRINDRLVRNVDDHALRQRRCNGSFHEDQENDFPVLASSDEEFEGKNRIEEVVRAEHARQRIFQQEKSFSANRAPPRKGCFFNPRPTHPSINLHRYKTPPKPFEELKLSSGSSDVNKPRRVQFGFSSAVEYEVDRPPGYLTPLLQEVARKRYPMDAKDPEEDEDITQETRQNNMILSEWEGSLQNGPSRRSASSRRKRRNRRTSSLFSPESRTLLEYDYKEQDQRNHRDKTENNENTHYFGPTGSQRNRIQSNSAPLRMVRGGSSPGVHQFESRLNGLHNFDKGKILSSSDTKCKIGDVTWDFVANLGSIHSKGAMELSPPNSNPYQIKTRIAITKDSRCMNEDTDQTINFDRLDSLVVQCGSGSPDYREMIRVGKSMKGSLVSLPMQISRNNVPRLTSQILLESPRADLGLNFPSLLQDLPAETSDDVEILWLNRWIQELVLEAHSPKDGNQLLSIPHANFGEWKDIEVGIMEDLSHLLSRDRLEVESSLATLKSAQDKDGSLGDEISMLERKICGEKSFLDVLNASAAPQSNIICQASSEIGVCGFHVEEVNDDLSLIVVFEHSIFGAETRITFEPTSPLEIKIQSKGVDSSEKMCSIQQFHREYMTMLADGKISFQTNETSVHDSIFKLGQILGRLDQCAVVFTLLNDLEGIDVNIEFPQVIFTLPLEPYAISLRLHPTRFFTTAISFPAIGKLGRMGSNTEQMPFVDCCDFFAVREIIKYFSPFNYDA